MLQNIDLNDTINVNYFIHDGSTWVPDTEERILLNQPGAFGENTAISFENMTGQGGYGIFEVDSTWKNLKNFTISVWVKENSSDSGTFSPIICTNDTNTDYLPRILSRYNSYLVPSFQNVNISLPSNYLHYEDIDKPYNTNEWTHLLFSYTAYEDPIAYRYNYNVNIYINGNRVVGSKGSTNNPNVNFGKSGSILIGNDTQGSISYGMIDDLTISNSLIFDKDLTTIPVPDQPFSLVYPDAPYLTNIKKVIKDDDENYLKLY